VTDFLSVGFYAKLGVFLGELAIFGGFVVAVVLVLVVISLFEMRKKARKQRAGR